MFFLFFAGSAAAAVLTLRDMERLLIPRFLQTKNQTEMNSDIITAFLPKTKHSNFSQPVNFTIQHKKVNRLTECAIVINSSTNPSVTTSMYQQLHPSTVPSIHPLKYYTSIHHHP